MKRMLSPNEIANETINLGIKKSRLTTIQTLLLAILGGMFISFGGHADITIMQTLSNIDVGLAKFMGAAVFPVGLMLVVIAGGELFTGNNLMTISLLDKKISFKGLFRNWTLVYIGNLIGSLILVLLVYKASQYKPDTPMAIKAIKIAEAKVGLSMSQALIRGILCNIIVSLAVWMSLGSKDITGKIFAIWFPVMMFVLSGFEHSIANMFFIPLGKILGANFTWADMIFKNIVPVTIGNIIGGGLLVPGFYYFAYINKSKKSNKQLSTSK